MPAPDALAAPGLLASPGVVMSIGHRPCTGAVLVLVLAVAGRGGEGIARSAAAWLSLAGGCAIAVLGELLLHAAFGPAHPLGL